MLTQTIGAAAFTEQTASKKPDGNYFNRFSSKLKKRKPAYYRELGVYPQSNPVLIATNWEISKFLRGLGGFCLLCLLGDRYDFSMLASRESWVLYSNSQEASKSLELATQLYQSDASNVKLILMEGYANA